MQKNLIVCKKVSTTVIQNKSKTESANVKIKKKKDINMHILGKLSNYLFDDICSNLDKLELKQLPNGVVPSYVIVNYKKKKRNPNTHTHTHNHTYKKMQLNN